MTVNKLERFAQITEFEHVLEYTDFQKNDRPKPAGNWHDIFGNNHPIILELACGRGDYTIELARRNSKKNYIGIDIKGARLWKGATKALEEDLQNVRFLRMFIEHLDEYFAVDEVSEIWITFPDPYPRTGDRNKRLTSPRFLAIYEKILAPGGAVHLKTDDRDLFAYSCRSVKETGGRVIKKINQVHQQRVDDEQVLFKTTYEKHHLQNDKTIFYAKCELSEP